MVKAEVMDRADVVEDDRFIRLRYENKTARIAHYYSGCKLTGIAGYGTLLKLKT